MCSVMSPPFSPVEPVTDILHKTPVTDPYRWLEEQNSVPTQRWLEEQTTYARRYLDNLPERKQIRARVEELLAVEVISEPWKVGNRYFYLKRTARGEQPAIILREGEQGDETVLVDPADRDKSATTAVTILAVSRDANILAYAVRQGGHDPYSVGFIHVAERKILSDCLTRGFCRGLVFATDGTGFYYSHEPMDGTSPCCRAVFWHAFGTSPLQDRTVFFGGDSPKLRLVLLSSPTCSRLGYYKRYATDPKRSDFFVEDIAAGTPSRLVVEQVEGLFVPYLQEGGLLALTDWKAPNCRVVKIDLHRPQPEYWRDVVPESDSRIQSISLAGESIFVAYVRDLATHVEMVDLSGQRLGTLPLPSHGTASFFPCRPDTDTIFYRFTSFTHPPSILIHRIHTPESQIWASSKISFDPSSIEIERVVYPSKDGTRIPMFLVCRKDRRLAGPLPTFLTGYGGFGSSITPKFTAHASCLIERGCLFAVANIRGGAEFGEAWHLAAQRHNRQTAVDDFIAAAEWLLAEGYAEKGRMAIGGASNAGLLVGAALTQRPSLFRAAICLGPLLDMLRYHLFDFADKWTEEYGSPQIEKDFQALLRYSPYHAVRRGVPYPAVMLISGGADTRCNPMHARKMVARLQAATCSEHPILLDYRPAWGHVPTQSLGVRTEALTDRLAFLHHELGLAP